MNTQRIKILLAAIDYGSFTRAGAELGYTQSYLTQTMKAFEEEIGFPLLNKTNRGVEPTNEAKMLLPSMRKLIRCEERVSQEMAEIQGIKKGNLRSIGDEAFLSCPKLKTVTIPKSVTYIPDAFDENVKISRFWRA